MVSDPRTERFLSLEGTANDLVDELNEIREQISKYKEASDSLSAGSEALETLAKELATLVESVGETIRAEIDLGMPQALSLLDSLAVDQKTLSDEISNSRRLVTGGLSGVAILSIATLILVLVR
jgi:predicted transcriptional regulator